MMMMFNERRDRGTYQRLSLRRPDSPSSPAKAAGLAGLTGALPENSLRLRPHSRPRAYTQTHTHTDVPSASTCSTGGRGRAERELLLDLEATEQGELVLGGHGSDPELATGGAGQTSCGGGASLRHVSLVTCHGV